MANKITKKDNFKAIIEVLANNGREDLVKVMEHEIELIEKKASNAKMTKNQEENENIKQVILEEMARIGRAVTITELINESKQIAEMTNGSNQKVSALMTQLKTAKLVERIQEGKKATFIVA